MGVLYADIYTFGSREYMRPKPNNFRLQITYTHACTICTYCLVYCYIHMLNLKYFEYYTVCYISIAYLLTRLLLPSFNPQNWCDTDKYLHTRNQPTHPSTHPLTHSPTYTHTHARIHEHTKQRKKHSQLCLNKLKGSKPFQTTYKFKSTTKTCSHKRRHTRTSLYITTVFYLLIQQQIIIIVGIFYAWSKNKNKIHIIQKKIKCVLFCSLVLA